MITIITGKKVINICGLKDRKKQRIELLADIMDRQVGWLAHYAKQFKNKKAGITYIDRVANEAKRKI